MAGLDFEREYFRGLNAAIAETRTHVVEILQELALRKQVAISLHQQIGELDQLTSALSDRLSETAKDVVRIDEKLATLTRDLGKVEKQMTRLKERKRELGPDRWWHDKKVVAGLIALATPATMILALALRLLTPDEIGALLKLAAKQLAGAVSG